MGLPCSPSFLPSKGCYDPRNFQIIHSSEHASMRRKPCRESQSQWVLAGPVICVFHGTLKGGSGLYPDRLAVLAGLPLEMRGHGI